MLWTLLTDALESRIMDSLLKWILLTLVSTSVKCGGLKSALLHKKVSLLLFMCLSGVCVLPRGGFDRPVCKTSDMLGLQFLPLAPAREENQLCSMGEEGQGGWREVGPS